MTQAVPLVYRICRLARALVLVLPAVSLLSACDGSSDTDEEGGVVGTGIILRGTASENRAFASNEIGIKAQSGELSLALIGERGRYQASMITGSGPWLLRTDLGNTQYRYGIAYSEQPANIHSYSDVILRNWFARNGNADIDAIFDTAGVLPALPAETMFRQAANGLFAVLDLVLASYSVSGDQLLVAAFDADNTGIDRYLDNNPVVIDGQTITVLLTDPSSQTQSITRSLLALDADLAKADQEPPRAPGSVRVLGSASDQIVVVWEPAEDNIGIARYQVFRDGEMLESTPYPVYTDNNLQAGTSYRYEIAAADAAGNTSARSAEAVGSTLAAPDIQPPPAPVTLTELRATSNRIDLIWGQTDIGDVVRFNIYRGGSAASLQLLLKVTSTIMTDATVTGGQRYCYQVSAEDASGNESARSEVLCVDTPGGSTTPPPGGEDSVPALAGLTIPDTFSLACTTTLSVASITENTTLAESCYLVEQSVTIEPFINLTLSAGTVLKFAAGTRLQVNEGASLTINGLPEFPVVMTGQQPLPGFWEGVLFNRSNHPANLVRNAVIEYAGGGQLEGGLVVVSSVGLKSRIRVENSLFRFSSRYGVSFPSLGTVVDAFSGNLVTRNNRPAVINLESLHVFVGINDFSGNDEQIIDVPGLTTPKDIVIPDLGVPLLSNGIRLLRSSLTIEAGVDMLFLGGSGIEIDGEFVTTGSQAKPIRLTAVIPSAGQWVGISLADSSNANLQHTVVEFAGGASSSILGGDNGGAIRMTCSGVVPARLTLDNSDIVSSGGWGIFLDQAGCELDIGQEVQLINNASGDINIQ